MLGRGRRSGQTPEYAFTEEVADLLRRADGVTAVTVSGPLRIVVRQTAQPLERTALLDGLFRKLNAAPEASRQTLLNAWLEAQGDHSLTEGAPWAQVADHILPVARPVVALQAKQLMGEAAFHPERLAGLNAFEPIIVTFPIDAVLGWCLVIDRPHSVHYVDQRDEAFWGQNGLTLIAKAWDNLGCTGLRGGPLDGVPGAFGCIGQGDYTSSFMVVPDLYEEAARRLGGEVVSFAPAFDVMCFARRDDLGAVEHALNWAVETFKTSGNWLSPLGYVLREGGGVVRWPDPPEALMPQFALASRLLLYRACALQRQVLQDVAEVTGEDVFVAQAGLLELPGYGTSLAATWPEGADNGLVPAWVEHVLLPDGDEVCVVPARTAWEVGKEYVQQVPVLSPSLLRVNGWPREHVAVLRQQAVAVVPRSSVVD